MIEFLKETLLLLPFLYGTYLVLEAVEAKAGGALGRFLGRARSFGPFAGAIAGVVPQCGVSAAAASLYAGGVITVGTLLAVFLSTSDELLPVLISRHLPMPLIVKIAAVKIAGALAAGLAANAFLKAVRHKRRPVSVGELCEHSHCKCAEGKGIFLPALVHTLEIFVFIALVSGAIELAMHFWGEAALDRLCLNVPVAGELIAGAIGLVPNCAVSVAAAELYCKGAMSAGAMMSAAFTGSGLGLLVLFRTNRNLKENLFVLAAVYATGVLLGLVARFAF